MGAVNVLTWPLWVGWGAWLSVGLVLLVWSRRVRAAAAMRPAPRVAARPPTARPRTPGRLATPSTLAHGADVFGELQAMLDPPTSASRRPGD